MAAAERPPRARRRWVWALAGAGALACLAVALLLSRHAPPRRPAPGPHPGPLQPAYAHFTVQWLQQEGGTWQPAWSMECWQAGTRQWQRQTFAGGARDGRVLYSYYPGRGLPGSCTYASWRGLRMVPEDRNFALFYLLDWGAELAKQSWPGVTELARRQHRGKPVRVYRLTGAAVGKHSEMLLYVDPESNRPVMQQDDLAVPHSKPERIVTEYDYTPFDPATLFDPVQMAKEQAAAAAGPQ